MRAYLWLGLGGLMWACSGTAFTSQGGASGRGGSDAAGGDEATAGAADRAGATGRGGDTVSGGNTSGGGNTSIGGDLGIAGDLVIGGSQPIGGEPGVSGMSGGGTGPILEEACPVEAPIANAACVTGLSCTYGNDPRPDCRDRATCTDGAWQLVVAECEAVAECKGVDEGKECDANGMQACAGLGNTYCVCTGCSGVGPCSTNTVWRCAKPPTNNTCPRLLPNEGKACTKEVDCSYGACVTSTAMNATCDGKTWQWLDAKCPQ